MPQINLALQGGGAHGAFSWGVLDVLLQLPEIEIAAISGTSAGALNGAALKAGKPEHNRRRYPHRRAQLTRSHCPGCRKKLTAADQKK